MSCFASRGRGRGRGLGVAVGAAVGTALGAVVGVAVGVDTAAGAAVGPPNLPIPLAGRYGYFIRKHEVSYSSGSTTRLQLGNGIGKIRSTLA